MLAFRNEKDPERSLTFFNVIPQLTLVRYLTVIMGVPGLIAAFITPWWRQGWVWASLVVFMIVSFVMYKYGSSYFVLMHDAANQVVEAKNSGEDATAALKSYEEARSSPHPIIVSLVGMAGLAIILWLMRFKPF
jgi:hypothetical protein